MNSPSLLKLRCAVPKRTTISKLWSAVWEQARVLSAPSIMITGGHKYLVDMNKPRWK